MDWEELITSPIVIISAVLIGTLGEVLKRAVNSKELEVEVVAFHHNSKKGPAPAMWRRIFYYTLPAHAVFIGIALGFIPWLPIADALAKPGYDLASRVGTYGLAGVMCKIGYDTLISTMKRTLKKGLPGGSPSNPPPADGDKS